MGIEPVGASKDAGHQRVFVYKAPTDAGPMGPRCMFVTRLDDIPAVAAQGKL